MFVARFASYALAFLPIYWLDALFVGILPLTIRPFLLAIPLFLVSSQESVRMSLCFGLYVAALSYLLGHGLGAELLLMLPPLAVLLCFLFPRGEKKPFTAGFLTVSLGLLALCPLRMLVHGFYHNTPLVSLLYTGIVESLLTMLYIPPVYLLFRVCHRHLPFGRKTGAV